MTSRIGYVSSSIGKKQIMAVAGLGLCLFVLSHVLGNFLLFVGPEAYNMYSYKLISNPLIYVAEAGLLAIFIAHIVAAVLVTLQNWKARKQGYAVAAQGEKRTSLIQKTMWWQGVVILVFVAFHLITFKFGPHYDVQYGDLVVRDLYRLVVEVFQSPAYVVWYVVAVSILGAHLIQGLQASLSTLGLNHPRYTPKVKVASLVYGIFIALGFAAQPVFMLLNLNQ
jgi:succinate dehydrogenase / fumarate reductase, cytochrome b subunit